MFLVIRSEQSRAKRAETLSKWAVMDEQRLLLAAEFPPTLGSRAKQERVKAFEDSMIAAVRQRVCAICGERVHVVVSLTFDEIGEESGLQAMLKRTIAPSGPIERTSSGKSDSIGSLCAPCGSRLSTSFFFLFDVL
jgi:hypothetical protein